MTRMKTKRLSWMELEKRQDRLTVSKIAAFVGLTAAFIGFIIGAVEYLQP